jgi:hypothetical protein
MQMSKIAILLYSPTQKHDISPLNGPIYTIEMPSSLAVIIREAIEASGGQ